ncbi:MAG: SpoIIE family protein phosphatase [Ruminococcus sp.]|nr:SpoIIE family protein phosphatase [Ruminococcus sp.]
MKRIFGLKIGGLQQKIFNLGTLLVLVIIGVYIGAAVYQAKSLSTVSEETNSELQKSITQVSDDTMDAVVKSSLVRNSAYEAERSDEMFADVEKDVKNLAAMATELYKDKGKLSLREVGYPDKANNGKPTAQLQHSEGADPGNSELFAVASNLQDIMVEMFRNSDKLSSCIISTVDGCTLFVDDRAGEYFDENGDVIKIFDAPSRPWFKGAAAAGGIYFTGLERDSFTDYVGVVCACPVYCDGELVAVAAADIFLDSMSEYISSTAEDGGFVCMIDENGHVIFSPEKEGTFEAIPSEEGADLRETGSRELSNFIKTALTKPTELCKINVDGTDYYLAGAPMKTVGWAVVTGIPVEVTRLPAQEMISRHDKIVEEANGKNQKSADKSLQTVLIVTVVVLGLAAFASLRLAKYVVGPIERMTTRIGELRDGDLAFEMEDSYRTNDEVEELATAFADLSARTQKYIADIREITAEKERIGAELSIATQIQADMLPRIFPAFPGRKEFELYATMDPAKEVGGAFYDFFLIDEDHLALVMADVSGKGIPAALFMVIAKTLIKNYAQMGDLSPARVLSEANEQLCEGNKSDLFVTVWLAVIEISTGKGMAANAGHEHPAVMRKDGSFELIKNKHSPAVACMPGMKFREHEFQINPGDTLFVYTDGVPEATNAEDELFGADRMIEALNKSKDKPLRELLADLRSEIDGFVKEAPQFDDLTMLAMRYYGAEGKSDTQEEQTEQE